MDRYEAVKLPELNEVVIVVCNGIHYASAPVDRAWLEQRSEVLDQAIRALDDTVDNFPVHKGVIPVMETQTINLEGQWVPAIPLPYYQFWKLCPACLKPFWSARRYREHYALEHILKLP